MDKSEAVSVIEELIEQRITSVSFVYLSKNQRGKYDLIINGDCNVVIVRAFLAGKNLVVSEDKDTCRIHRP